MRALWNAGRTARSAYKAELQAGCKVCVCVCVCVYVRVQVVRTALTDAASVSSLITTSEAVIVEAPEEKKMPNMPAPPDMY